MLKKVLAEFLGAFFFIFVILYTHGHYLAVGASLALVIFLVGKISGGNINPAVSISLHFSDRLNFDLLIPYIVAQILGGISAVMLYKWKF